MKGYSLAWELLTKEQPAVGVGNDHGLSPR